MFNNGDLLPPDTPGEEVVKCVGEVTDTVFLAFSTGKDSIAAYLAIRDRIPKVIPYYMYLIPNLSFIEADLGYYEKNLFGGRRIIRVPHPSLYRMLNAFVFQPPEHLSVIEKAGLPEFDYQDMFQALCADNGIDPETAMTASGVRASDSPMRRRHFSIRGAITWSRRTFYPVWDWNKARLIQETRNAGISLGVQYLLFNRSFDGLDLRFLYPVKKHFPEDYKKILQWFPLADLEIMRYEWSKKPV